MKRATFIFILSFLCLAASAQTSESKFHFGLKATPTIAWLRTDSKDLTANGNKIGFNYGLIADFNFAGNYAFSTGLDISYRGGKFKSITSATDPNGIAITTTQEMNNTLEYIELPLTLKLKTNEIGYFTYFLQFGPEAGVNIRARQSLKTTTQLAGGEPFVKDTSGVDIQKSINNLNVSLIIAAGLEYNLSGNTNLLAAIVFNNGFLDVLDDKNQKANSNFLGLSLGVLF